MLSYHGWTEVPFHKPMVPTMVKNTVQPWVHLNFTMVELCCFCLGSNIIIQNINIQCILKKNYSWIHHVNVLATCLNPQERCVIVMVWSFTITNTFLTQCISFATLGVSLSWWTNVSTWVSLFQKCFKMFYWPHQNHMGASYFFTQLLLLHAYYQSFLWHIMIWYKEFGVSVTR